MFTALRQKIQQHADKIQIGRTGAHLREWFKNNPNASRVEQVDAAYAIIARYSPLDKELWGCKAIEYVTDYRIEHHQWPITTPEKSTVEIAEKAWLEAHKAAKAAAELTEAQEELNNWKEFLAMFRSSFPNATDAMALVYAGILVEHGVCKWHDDTKTTFMVISKDPDKMEAAFAEGREAMAAMGAPSVE
jgi:hypothetical protein